jgi:hypothetical protein
MVDLIENAKWALVALILPFTGWVRSKFKEYNNLVQRVSGLETKVEHVIKHIEEDREDRKRTSDKIDKIYEVLTDVQVRTSVNESKLNNKKQP